MWWIIKNFQIFTLLIDQWSCQSNIPSSLYQETHSSTILSATNILQTIRIETKMKEMSKIWSRWKNIIKAKCMTLFLVDIMTVKRKMNINNNWRSRVYCMAEITIKSFLLLMCIDNHLFLIILSLILRLYRLWIRKTPTQRKDTKCDT